MPITALYRLNGGEVLKISPLGQSFADRDPAYYGVLADPVLPDGNQVREDIDGALRPMRVLGFAKIAITASNTVRNATQPEIDVFAVAETSDDDAQDREQARALLDHPRFGPLLGALLDEMEAAKPAGQRRARAALVASVKSRIL